MSTIVNSGWGHSKDKKLKNIAWITQLHSLGEVSLASVPLRRLTKVFSSEICIALVKKENSGDHPSSCMTVPSHKSR